MQAPILLQSPPFNYRFMIMMKNSFNFEQGLSNAWKLVFFFLLAASFGTIAVVFSDGYRILNMPAWVFAFAVTIWVLNGALYAVNHRLELASPDLRSITIVCVIISLSVIPLILLLGISVTNGDLPFAPKFPDFMSADSAARFHSFLGYLSLVFIPSLAFFIHSAVLFSHIRSDGQDIN